MQAIYFALLLVVLLAGQSIQSLKQPREIFWGSPNHNEKRSEQSSSLDASVTDEDDYFKSYYDLVNKYLSPVQQIQSSPTGHYSNMHLVYGNSETIPYFRNMPEYLQGGYRRSNPINYFYDRRDPHVLRKNVYNAMPKYRVYRQDVNDIDSHLHFNQIDENSIKREVPEIFW